MKKELTIIFSVFFLIIVGVILLFLWAAEGLPDAQDVVPAQPAPVEAVEITQASCGAAGGEWDACGSACRENPGGTCIEVCVEYCGCTSDVQCPSGTVCGEFVDGEGVCLANN